MHSYQFEPGLFARTLREHVANNSYFNSGGNMVLVPLRIRDSGIDFSVFSYPSGSESHSEKLTWTQFYDSDRRILRPSEINLLPIESTLRKMVSSPRKVSIESILPPTFPSS